MDALRFFLSHYSVIGLLTLVSYVLGARLLLRFRFESKLEQVCFSIALGLGVIAYLVLFLGLLGLLYPSITILILLISLALCYPVWTRWPRDLSLLYKRIRNSKRSQSELAIGLATAVLTIVLSVPVLVLPLYPPTASDETMYHLPAAKQYVENHRVVFTPYLRFPVFPQTNEMLFTFALLFYDDILAHLFQSLLMMVLVIAVASFGLRFFSLNAGWWSAAILLANPLVLWSGTVGYVEMALMVFTTMMVYGFWNWWQTREQHWLVLAGVFCGLAIGTKYTSMFFLIVLQVAALYIGFRQRKPVRPLIFGLVAFATSSPWFARNLYYMRNPVFPYFYKPFLWVFGAGRLDPETYAGITREVSAYGVGKSLRSLVMLPWHLAFHQHFFVVEAPLSSLYLYLLPLLVVCGVAVVRLRGVLLLTAAYTLFWFFSAQILRYLLPALPLLSLAAGASLDYFFVRIPYLHRLKRYKAITVLGFAVLVFPGWNYDKYFFKYSSPLPVTQPQRDAYLTARLPSYPAYQLLNRLKGANYKIYAYNDANMNYFADGLFIGDWFGPGQYALIDSSVISGEKLHTQLKALGADYFLLRSARWPGHLPNDEFFKRHFRLIYAQSDVSLYEITERPFQQRTVELLQNPGFEQLIENKPAGWMMTGRPATDSSAKNSATGSVAVRCTGAGDVVYQSVTVKPGDTYMMAGQARGIDKDQSAKFQVNWVDVQGILLREDLHVIKADSNWHRYEKELVAPERAAWAVIYLDALDQASVWFDDVSFSQTTYVTQPE